MRTLLSQGLKEAGFTVFESGNLAALLQCLETQRVDLITLDLNLGNEDGLEIARSIRTSRNVPIIMITGRVTGEDRITGLESGADDYIAKPFLIREVVLRIRGVLGRYGPLQEQTGPHGENERYEIGTATLDVARRELKSQSGSIIDLTSTEFELLTILVRRPGRILSRDDLMHLLKGRNWSPLDRTLDKHIARLRKKIESPNEAPRLIKTVRAVGYVFTGDVTRN